MYVMRCECEFCCLWGAACYVCFFFQAEDGIRDGRVTGVQTCALPICRDPSDDLGVRVGWRERDVELVGVARRELRRALGAEPRSEERRVGKECRSRWSP